MFHIDKQFLPEIAIYSRYISVLSYNIQTYIFITILKYLPFKNKKNVSSYEKVGKWIIWEKYYWQNL